MPTNLWSRVRKPIKQNIHALLFRIYSFINIIFVMELRKNLNNKKDHTYTKKIGLKHGSPPRGKGRDPSLSVGQKLGGHKSFCTRIPNFDNDV